MASWAVASAPPQSGRLTSQVPAHQAAGLPVLALPVLAPRPALWEEL